MQAEAVIGPNLTAMVGIRYSRCPIYKYAAKGFEVDLVQQYILIRAIQRKRRYLNIKLLPPIVFHLVASAHHPRGRVEMSTTRVCITLARLEEWLLPNHTRPLDLCQFTARIRDHPMPASQLNRFPSLILNGHSIGPEILRITRR